MRFVRSKDGAIFGVCKGLAHAFDIPVGWVRLLWLLSICAAGAGVGLYLLLAITLPREDKTEEALKPWILGVCAKLARRSNLEVGLLRFLAICLALLSFGAAVVGYVVLYFIIDEPSAENYRSFSRPSSPPETT
jgi:phage shock protein C